VTVNGEVVLIPGTHIDPEKDEVLVDGEPVKPVKEKVYIMLNKPPGYLSTVKSEDGRPTVIDLVKDVKLRIFPVGRLDYDTEGLLLLTNDGDFAYKLTHPKFKVEKVYHAWVQGVPSPDELDELRRGVQTKYFKASPAKVRILKIKDGNALLELILHEGRKRQVKHMCAAIGHRVVKLKRVQIGPLKLGKLPKGRYRYLTKDEVEKLLRAAEEGYGGGQGDMQMRGGDGGGDSPGDQGGGEDRLGGQKADAGGNGDVSG